MKLKKIKRNDSGLISGSSVDYVYNEDGFVDWRKMVNTDHLVPNKQKTSETDVSKLEDHQLIILLAGIKELAQIRGYTNIRYQVTSPSPDYVVATCSIDWIPNYETEDRVVTFSAIGDASPHNTQSFAKFFLGPIAENRAFVRCVVLQESREERQEGGAHGVCRMPHRPVAHQAHASEDDRLDEESHVHMAH